MLFKRRFNQIIMPDEIAELTRRCHNADYIIVKRSDRGCTLLGLHGDGTCDNMDLPAFAVSENEIVTDIGNGDFFNACMVLGFLDGCKTVGDLADYALLANLAASLKLYKKAGQFPTVKEISTALNAHDSITFYKHHIKINKR